MDSLALQTPPAFPVLKDPLVLLDHKGRKVHREIKAIKAIPERPARPERKDLPGHNAHRARTVPKVPLAQQGPSDHKDLPVRTALFRMSLFSWPKEPLRRSAMCLSVLVT